MQQWVYILADLLALLHRPGKCLVTARMLLLLLDDRNAGHASSCMARMIAEEV